MMFFLGVIVASASLVGVGGALSSLRSVYELREEDYVWHKMLTESPEGKEELACSRKYMRGFEGHVCLSVCDSGPLVFDKYRIRRMLYLGNGEKYIRSLIVSPGLAGKNDNAVWNYPANPALAGELLATMQHGNLWILRQDSRLEKAGSASSYFTGSNHALCVFEKGNKDCAVVPLSFGPVPGTRSSRKKQSANGLIHTKPVIAKVLAADTGLVLVGRNIPGVWHIPLQDLRAFVASEGQLSSGMTSQH